jgi:hypothetical protein
MLPPALNRERAKKISEDGKCIRRRALRLHEDSYFAFEDRSFNAAAMTIATAFRYSTGNGASRLISSITA